MPRPPTSAKQNRDDACEESAYARLPKPILLKLRKLIRRVRTVQVIRGAVAVLAAIALSSIAIMAVDTVFTILSPSIHFLLTFIGFGVVAFTAYRTLFLPLNNRISIPQIARVLETRNPELEERISTSISLLGRENGSEQLVAQIVHDAVGDAKSVLPRREFTTRTARHYLIALGASTALILIAWLVFPRPTGRLLTRAIAPFSKVGNAYSDRLDISPGHQRVAIGDPVTIKVTLMDSDANRAEIRRTNPGRGNTESVETMSLVKQDEDGGTSDFVVTFPAVTEKFTYRIRSGRAVSSHFEIETVPRPAITSFSVKFTPPAYTGLNRFTVNDIDQDIIAVSGTQIQIDTDFDRPLNSAVLSVDGNPMPADFDDRDHPSIPRTSWKFEMAPATDATWRIALTDEENFSNIPRARSIRSIPDRPPTVEFLAVKDQLRIRPDERLRLPYLVTEDFGVTWVEAIIRGEGTNKLAIEQEIPAEHNEDSDQFIGEAVVDLGKIPNIEKIKNFTLTIRVKDNRPDRFGGAQVTESAAISISVDPRADTLAEQFVNEQRISIKDSLESAIRELEEAKVLGAPAPGQLVKPDTIPHALISDLNQIQDLVGGAEASVREAAVSAAAPSSLFKQLAKPLMEIADDHIVTARQSAGEIPLTDEKVRRVHRARMVINQIDESIADLNVKIRELKQMNARAKLIAKMSDIGSRQRELAESLAKADDPSLRNQLRDQQQQLAESMQQLVEESKQTVGNRLQDARQIAKRLAEQATSLREKQARLTDLFDQCQDPGQREKTRKDLISWLEVEQGELGDEILAVDRMIQTMTPEASNGAELKEARIRSDNIRAALTSNEIIAAANISQENAQSLGQLDQGFSSPEVFGRLKNLSSWQSAIASQLKSLDQNEPDEALAAMQDRLADSARELARNTIKLRSDAESLADPAALQQVQQAGSEASKAAQAASQASAQLGGKTSTAAFDFSLRPDEVSNSQNFPSNVPPPPTQAGVTDPTQLPGIRSADHAIESPFSSGSSKVAEPPPSIEQTTQHVAGGSLPPTDTEPPPSPVALESRQGESSGQDSVASAARQPAMQAQHALAAAADSLSNAAGNLAQQANSPSVRNQPQISQKMLEAAQQAARAALENNPELAAKAAAAIAQNIDELERNIPTPDVTNWSSVGGKTRSGLASRSRGSTPSEYRSLVKRYFKEIARRSNEPKSPNTEE